MLQFKELIEKLSFETNLNNQMELKTMPAKVKAGLLKAFKEKTSSSEISNGKDKWHIIHDKFTTDWLDSHIKFGCGSDGCEEIKMKMGTLYKVLATGQYRIKA
jgi:hypothetical protein